MSRGSPVPRPGEVLGRARLKAGLAALEARDRKALLALLRATLERARGEIGRRLDAGAPGGELVTAMSFAIDGILRALMRHVDERMIPQSNRLKGERLALVAVGGYGRGELAPYSDIDLLFLVPYKPTPWIEQVVETALYTLWDLNLEVGHAVRTVEDCIRRAGGDVIVETSLLESRFLWGDRAPMARLERLFRRDVVADSGARFARAKLAERDRRHMRMGSSRYVLEPDVKEGKGGLRDLHTLFWIVRHRYRLESVDALAGPGVFTRAELGRFSRARDFLNRVRCHLHSLSGRAEDRLTFDRQPEIARRMGFAGGSDRVAVERFMKRYFMVAKQVGDLTRIFGAAIEDARAGPGNRPRYGLEGATVEGFALDRGRLAVADRRWFSRRPGDLIRVFHIAERRALEIHPRTLRLITRNLARIDRSLRRDREANRLFVDILTSRRDPEGALRGMNEAGVLGRFLPDFGRAVARMQYDMYHAYTVDEHAIRAVGALAAIERGELAEELPLVTGILPRMPQRRVLYLAVLLHDIAKGRGGDHSVIGADIARDVGRRLDFAADEIDTLAWLVRRHLAMSKTAFRRDVDDPKTVEDFVGEVQSLSRLRLLLALTVADIRAVGPRVWNGWKGQLLRELYRRAEEVITGGHGPAIAKQARVSARVRALRARLDGWDARAVEVYLGRLVAPYWLAFDEAAHLRHAGMVRRAEERAGDGAPLAVETRVDRFRAVTEVTVFATDERGLFARLAGAIAVAGASIVEARIFTTTDGMALDTFWVQDENARAFDDGQRLQRLVGAVRDTLAGALDPGAEVERRRGRWLRGPGLPVEPRVLIDNDASSKHTVIEVAARDRLGLLHDLARTLADLGLSVVTARVATYGERAVDAFYVRDAFGLKPARDAQLARIRRRLLARLETPRPVDVLRCGQ